MRTVLAALAMTMLAPLAARATTCTVTTPADTSAAGTLRSCIMNADSASGVTINFSSSVDGGTITLQSSLPQITASMTIAGPGANLLTISGGHAVQMFSITSGTVNISGLTIANGTDNGGGIVNQGSLTVSNCTFSGNTAGGAGGAIFNDAGTLTVNNSTFSGNTSGPGGAGGGIFNNVGAQLTVNNSTFSGNTAAYGGGIYNDNVGAQLTVNNSTFSGNTAAVQGGGIFNNDPGTVTLSNSIVAGNTTTGDPGDDCDTCGAQSSNNLIGGNPQLVPLGWYGGSTQTMLPLPGSPAIGKGIATASNMDQRGFARPTTGSVDLGAVQTNYLIVITTADTSDNSPGCNNTGGTPCSLRDALTVAASGGTDIAFASGVTGTINLSTLGALPQITGNLDLFGPGANLLTVSGGARVGILSATSSNAAISGITIANGNPAVDINGGGILNLGTLTVNNSAFFGNTASVSGGAIYNSGTLSVTNSTFSNNNAGHAGGGIFTQGTLLVSNSTFSGNMAGSGGSIFVNNATAIINNSTLSGNTASNGGGIAASAPPVTLNNSIVAGNTSSGDPGDDCDMCGTQPSNNIISTPSAIINPQLAPLGWYGGPTQTLLPLPGSAAVCAGSVALDPAGLSTDQRGFPRTNLASGCVDAGAVQTNYLIVTTTTDVLDTAPPAACDAAGTSPCSLRDAMTLANPAGTDIAFASGVTGTIALNTGTNTPLPSITGNLDLFGPGANILTVSGGNSSSVGSVFTVTSPNAAISGITIAHANSSEGGGIYIISGALTVNNSAFSGNTAGEGGGIYINSGTLALANSTFSGNIASSEGGGIYINSGTLALANSTFSGNNAAEGGGIFLIEGTLIVTNSTFAGNIASGEGGGILTDSGTATLTNSTFSSNSASYGGGILNNGGNMTVSNSTVSGNTAGIKGGGLYNFPGTLTLTNSIVAGNTTDGVLGSDDCDSCGTQNSANLIGGAPQLAALGSYGGPTQTMLPLPGSPAICAGSPALDPAGLTTDQRGFPRLNTTYTGYSATTPCLDLGAVQTNYQSIQFAQSAYSGAPGVAVSSPADPVVSVTENGQNIGAVPVTLSFSGTAPTTVGGTGPVTTVAGTGATFLDLTASPGGSYTLEASLAITSSITISNTAALTIDTPATITSLTTTSPSGTYTTNAVIYITVNFSKAVTVTGTPQLALNSGGTASYSSGSGTSALVFKYTVGTGQSTTALDASSTTALTLKGGSINDSFSVAAHLTLPTPGGTGSLSASKTIVINTTQYTLTLLASPSAGGTVKANPTSTPNVTPALASGTYLSGTQVTLTATAKSPYIFSSWTGTTNSSSNPLIITMNSPVTEQANFVLPTITTSYVSPSPSVYGEPAQLIAEVSNGTLKPPNGGTVTFKTGSTIIGSGPVLNGFAVYNVGGLQVPAGGNPTIAYYSGDSTDAPSHSVSYEFLVIPAATTTTITYSPLTPVQNKYLTLTATVKPQYGGTPIGTVTFAENVGASVTIPLVNGTATYSFYPSQAGTFTLTAVYTPPINGNFKSSSDSVKLKIAKE